MTFNLYLLSIFYKDTSFGSDVKAYIERSQVLSTIYANFSIFLMIVGYEISAWFSISLPKTYTLTLIALPCVIICFLFLKQGNKEAAVITLLGYMHCANFFASKFMDLSLAALNSLMIFPNFAIFLTASRWTLAANGVLYICQIAHHIMRIREIFDVTMSEKQSFEIASLSIGIVMTATAQFVMCFIQNSLKLTTIEMAQSNFDRLEGLTIELVDTVKAKDEYAISLFQMLSNPVRTIKNSINQISDSIKEFDQLQIMRNARQNANIILSLISNNLNLAKLKAEFKKWELSVGNINLISTIQNAFILCDPSMKQNQVTVRVIIDGKLPRHLLPIRAIHLKQPWQIASPHEIIVTSLVVLHDIHVTAKN